MLAAKGFGRAVVVDDNNMDAVVDDTFDVMTLTLQLRLFRGSAQVGNSDSPYNGTPYEFTAPLKLILLFLLKLS